MPVSVWIATGILLVLIAMGAGRMVSNELEGLMAIVTIDENKVRAMAEAIAKAEGFGPEGNLATRLNNPGDLKDTRTGELIQFETIQAGWDALYRQVRLMLTGRSGVYKTDMTFYQVADLYTGGDNPDGWAHVVARELGRNSYDSLAEYVEA